MIIVTFKLSIQNPERNQIFVNTLRSIIPLTTKGVYPMSCKMCLSAVLVVCVLIAMFYYTCLVTSFTIIDFNVLFVNPQV